jgi:hypothetical protein
LAKGDQIFLCYARDDWSRVEPIYKKLLADFRPWVDKKSLRPGDRWRSAIPKAIRESKFFLVLLTSQSVTKRGYLQKEIKEALDVQDELPDGGRYLIPVRLEPLKIPERLEQIQSANLFEEDGWLGLLDILQEKEQMPPPITKTTAEKVVRPQRLGIGGIPLPCFFPSISSAAKNVLEPLDHLRVVVSLGFPQFLISAYDLGTATRADKNQLQRLMLQAAQKGQVVLLDSGLYEKRWLNTTGWTKARFRQVLRQAPCHIAFCYDEPDPPSGVRTISSQIVDALQADKTKSRFDVIAPIVHSNKAAVMPEVCTRVARAIDVPLIAVPERELGEGILECASSIRRIRSALNGLGKYIPLHVLGTGNPLSILAYTWAGADSFDGLDWCQTAADHANARLYHSLQLDFFRGQSAFAEDLEMSYMTRLLAHNLQFYGSWMAQIQTKIASTGLEQMLDDYLPKDFVVALKKLQ